MRERDALAMLRESGQAVSTSALADILQAPVGHPRRQRVLTLLGTALRRSEDAGHVRRAGQAVVNGRGLTVLWEITPSGTAWLDGKEQKEREKEQRLAGKQEEWQRQRMRQRALGFYAERQLPPGARARAIRSLRHLDCTYQEIGDALGLSRERIRQLLREDDPDADSQPPGTVTSTTREYCRGELRAGWVPAWPAAGARRDRRPGLTPGGTSGRQASRDGMEAIRSHIARMYS